MPEFSLITFKLKPVESTDIYAKFRSAQKIATGQSFIRDYQHILSQMEKRLGVEREVVTAILLVETHFGQNTGKELVINRLARVSSVAEPETLSKNYLRLKEENPSITFEQVRDRATYLEKTFLPELAALFTLSEREKIDIFDIRGSIAGAFGIPQFLPKSYLSFAIDGNNDGSISLFDLNDAVFSTASFLKNYGWKSILDEEKKRAVVWNYNHSAAYVDTIFWLAMGMKYQNKGV
jgi:membrane-bound lytic murein transglycosylase B